MVSFKKIVYKILNKKTKQEKLEKRVKILMELIEVQKRKQAKEPEEYAKNLVEDYSLDSFIVSKKDGKVLLSNEEKDAFEKAVKTTSFQEFLKTEYPDANLLIIKTDKNYNVLYSEDDLVFLFKTTGDISAIETKQIAKKIKQGIQDFKLK